MNLYCDGVDVGRVEVADTFFTRLRGMLGRNSLEVPMLIKRSNSVHSIGMRLTLEVAFISADGRVVEMRRLPPNRVLRPRHHARHVLEAKPGSFKRWNLRRNSRIEVR